MKKLMTLILVLALCVGVLPMGTLAADRKPVPKKVTYENSGDAPAVEVEYEDSGDFKWVEFYLLGDKAKEGDLKGPLGLIDIRYAGVIPIIVQGRHHAAPDRVAGGISASDHRKTMDHREKTEKSAGFHLKLNAQARFPSSIPSPACTRRSPFQ